MKNKFLENEIVYIPDIFTHGKIVSFWCVYEESNQFIGEEYNYMIRDYNGIEHERLEHEIEIVELNNIQKEQNNKVLLQYNCCGTCRNYDLCYPSNIDCDSANYICDNFDRK